MHLQIDVSNSIDIWYLDAALPSPRNNVKKNKILRESVFMINTVSTYRCPRKQNDNLFVSQNPMERLLKCGVKEKPNFLSYAIFC